MHVTGVYRCNLLFVVFSPAPLWLHQPLSEAWREGINILFEENPESSGLFHVIKQTVSPILSTIYSTLPARNLFPKHYVYLCIQLSLGSRRVTILLTDQAGLLCVHCTYTETEIRVLFSSMGFMLCLMPINRISDTQMKGIWREAHNNWRNKNPDKHNKANRIKQQSRYLLVLRATKYRRINLAVGRGLSYRTRTCPFGMFKMENTTFLKIQFFDNRSSYNK